jgi:hypothetical protein
LHPFCHLRVLYWNSMQPWCWVLNRCIHSLSTWWSSLHEFHQHCSSSWFISWPYSTALHVSLQLSFVAFPLSLIEEY